MGYGLIDNNTLTDIADAIRIKANTNVNYYPRDMARAINQLQSGGGFSTPVVFSLLQFGSINSWGGYDLNNSQTNPYNHYSTYLMNRLDFVNVLPTNNVNIIGRADWEPYSQGEVYLYSCFGQEVNGFVYGLYSPNVNPESISIIDMSQIYRGAQNVRGEAAFCTPYTYTMDCAFYDCYQMNGNAVCGNNVRYLRRTYHNCRGLNEAACGDNVIDMFGAYCNCYNIKNGIVGPKVENAAEAYSYCNKMQNLALDNSVRDIRNIAYQCSNLRNLSGGNNVVDAWYAFYYCSTLGNIVNMPKLVNAYYMFYNCISINPNQAYDFMVNAKNLVNTGYMFYGCSSLNKAYIHKNVEQAGAMFSNCFALRSVELDYENFNNYKLNSVGSMFTNCYSLSEPIPFPDACNYLYGTYANCYTLKNYWIGNNVTHLLNTYANCYSLNCDVEVPENVTDMSYAFYNCMMVKDVAIFCTNLNNTSNYRQKYAFYRYLNNSIGLARRNIVITHLNTFNTFLYCDGAGTWDKTNETYAEPVEVFVNGKSYNTVRCSYNVSYNCYIYCTE